MSTTSRARATKHRAYIIRKSQIPNPKSQTVRLNGSACSMALSRCDNGEWPRAIYFARHERQSVRARSCRRLWERSRAANLMFPGGTNNCSSRRESRAPVPSDTGVLLALADRSDAWHRKARTFLSSTDDTLLIPVTVLPEVAYLLHRRAGAVRRGDPGARLAAHRGVDGRVRGDRDG